MDGRRCFIESNHIHNIPSLIRHYDRDLLKFYLEIEVPEYIRDVGENNVEVFKEDWEILKSIYKDLEDPSVPG